MIFSFPRTRCCRFDRLGSVFLLLLCASSCIVPPYEREGVVLPPVELEFLSLVNMGKNYAARGRSELAEDYLRKALDLRPEVVSTQNDLAYALMGQRRFQEAGELLAHAIAKEPNNVILRENYVRLLYQQGNYEAALLECDIILDILDRYSPSELKSAAKTDIGPQERVSVYSSKAAIYYALGVFDEAVCYSWLAHMTAANFAEASRHSRLLLSLNKPSAALQILRDTVTVNKANVPANILLDYAIVLHILGEDNLAAAALSRLLTEPNMSRSDRRTAHLLRLLLAVKGNNARERISMVETLFEEDERLCEQKIIDPEGYWPIALIEEMTDLVDKLCHDEDQPLAKE